jgi:hypothetical protein
LSPQLGWAPLAKRVAPPGAGIVTSTYRMPAPANPVKTITTEPTTLPAWHVVIAYKTGADTTVDCVSEDHARLVMQNYLRAAFVEPDTKVFTCTYDATTHSTVHTRDV